MIDHITIKRLAELSGFTEKAIRRKIESGMWLEGVVWCRAPDDRILIIVSGYTAWAEGRGYAQLVRKPSRSTSDGAESVAGNVFDLNRRRPTSSSPRG